LVRWANEDGLSISEKTFKRSLERQVADGTIERFPTFKLMNGSMVKGPNAYRIKPVPAVLLAPMNTVRFELTEDDGDWQVYSIVDTGEPYWPDHAELSRDEEIELDHQRVMASLADLDLAELQATWPENPEKVRVTPYTSLPKSARVDEKLTGGNRVYGPLQPFGELKKQWIREGAA
jgi:hypothetical protein